MPILVHETTLIRAQRILNVGPDAAFVEPSGTGMAEGFSKCLENGPFIWLRGIFHLYCQCIYRFIKNVATLLRNVRRTAETSSLNWHSVIALFISCIQRSRAC